MRRTIGSILILLLLLSSSVVAQAPVADFSASTVQGAAPLTVSFTDLSTNSPTSWLWDWGDSTDQATTQNPSNTWHIAGTYTVTLTATNASGSDTETKVAYIHVTNPTPKPAWAQLPLKDNIIEITSATSFPFTLSQSGDPGDSLQGYRITGLCVAQHRALTLADGLNYVKVWSENGTADSLLFGNDLTTDGAWGINSGDATHHIFLCSLNVAQRNGADPTWSTADTSYALWFAHAGGGTASSAWNTLYADCNDDVHTWFVYDCNFHGGRPMDCSSVKSTCGTGIYGIYITGGNYTSMHRSYRTRHDPCAAIDLGNPNIDAGTYNWRITHTHIDHCAHAGMTVGGIAWMDSNWVLIDAFNDASAGDFANCHSIADNGAPWGGTHAYGNITRCGTNNGGGLGLYFSQEGPVTSVDSLVWIAYNDVKSWQGPSAELSAARGMRTRYGAHNLRVHDNLFRVYADDNPATTYMSDRAHGIWFSALGEEIAGDTSHNCWYYNNEIWAFYDNSTSGDLTTQCAGIVMDQRYGGFNNRFFNNEVHSPVTTHEFGAESHDADSIVVDGDAIYWEDPHQTDGYTHTGFAKAGSGPESGMDNWLIDCSYHNCDPSQVDNGTGSADAQIYQGRTAVITVVDASDQIVVGANVTITDAYSTVHFTGVTDANGQVVDTVPFRFNAWSGETTVANLAAFSPYAFHADNGAGASADSSKDVNPATTAGDDWVITLKLAAADAPPIANFSGTPTSGAGPLIVSFTDLSANTPTSWDWDWGDGSAHGTTQHPSHEYAEGTYTVTLTATNAFGSDGETKVDYITVSAAPAAPVADFSGSPTSGTAPLSVSFTDLSTNTPTSWSWTFGDGVGTSTTQNPTYEYGSEGTYTVSLTATNATGSDGETKVGYITVTSLPAGGDTDSTMFTGTNFQFNYLHEDVPDNTWSTLDYFRTEIFEDDDNVRSTFTIRNIRSLIGVDPTMTQIVCSVKTYPNTIDAGWVDVFAMWKPFYKDTASWNEFFKLDLSWGVVGCDAANDAGSHNSLDGSGDDRKATALDSMNITTTTNTWYTFVIDGSDLADTNDAGDFTGILIARDEAGVNTTEVRFYNDEAADPADRPRAWVYYTNPGGDPPAAGGFATRRRRL